MCRILILFLGKQYNSSQENVYIAKNKHIISKECKSFFNQFFDIKNDNMHFDSFSVLKLNNNWQKKKNIKRR